MCLGQSRRVASDGFRPIGETDSELAFCVLLERLRLFWRRATGAPGVEQRRRIVAAFAQELRALGPAIFIYADGDALFAHGHQRTHDGGTVRPPGLHLLCRSCNAQPAGFDTQGLRIVPIDATGAQVLIASVPLTAHASWRPLAWLWPSPWRGRCSLPATRSTPRTCRNWSWKAPSRI